GHGENARRPGAERDEGDVTEREHAGVADEQVESDDDRDIHERLEEVRLQRGRDGESEQRRSQDECGRTEQLGEPAERHRRSRAPPGGANRPFGRTSSTRMTAANRKLGRYWLWFVGRTPPRNPLAKPIEKPPSVAEIGRFSPPRTTPASTM